MALLDDADMAYLRGTQTEAQPVTATLLRRQAAAGDGMGGRTATYPDDGPSTTVRLTNVVDKSEGGDVPQVVAAKYQASDLIRVHADAANGVSLIVGDRLVTADLTYEVVSDARTRAWGTAHICWAVAL